MYLIFLHLSNEEKEFWFFQQFRAASNSIVALGNILGAALSPVLTPCKYYLWKILRKNFTKTVHLP
jgi:hypothetical protein